MAALLQPFTNWAPITCCDCGMTFHVPEFWRRERLEKGGGFHCPNGHPLRYGETELDRLRKQVEQEKKRAEWARTEAEDWRKQCEASNRTSAAVRGHLTRVKKRIAAGVCPCCKRSFRNVERHMRNKHPDYASHEAAP
jgi:hypothetical protein